MGIVAFWIQGYTTLIPNPHVNNNLVRNILDKNWEYVGYDLSFRKFKTQVNVYLKNRRHALKLLIESGVGRLDDCGIDHWENIKCFITLKAKQNEVTKNCAMHAFVTTPSHFSHGGKVGATYRLVRSILHISNMFFQILDCWLIFMHFCNGSMTSLHWVICFLGL